MNLIGKNKFHIIKPFVEESMRLVIGFETDLSVILIGERDEGILCLLCNINPVQKCYTKCNNFKMSIHPTRCIDRSKIEIDDSIEDKKAVIIVPFRDKQFYDQLKRAENPMIYSIRKNKKEWEIYGNGIPLLIKK